MKYKKEITLTACAILTMATVVRFVPSDKPEEVSLQTATETTVELEEAVASNGFTVSVDGVEIAKIASYDEGQAAVNKAIELAIGGDLGYNPEVEPSLILTENFSLDTTYTSVEDLANILKENLISGLEQVKVKAYVMKIGDDFTVAVRNEEDIKEVLKNAQSIYINSDDMILDITLSQDERNQLVLTPEVTMVKEDAMTASRTFTAEGEEIDGQVNENTDGTDETATEEASTDEVSEEVIDEVNEEDEEEVEEEKDERTDGTTVAVAFAEDVMIVETYVYEGDIKHVDEATELITKENDEPKIYEVQSGDVPSIIAESNEMGLTELYNMNPGLKENATKMQIGDELIVMVPEPELSVATQEEVVYTEPISRGVTYVDNPNKYVGSNTITDSGYDGILQLTAIVSKVNGDEISREITDEMVLKDPKDKVISRGSKPLPAKGATGNYIMPLIDYRITSAFGYRWGGGFHYGVDFAAPTGTSVRAADGGRVTIAGWHGNYGYLVEIDHGDGVRTRYGHNSKINVSVGQEVSQYEEIAKVGSTGRSTGPHVHFEIRFDGVCANPMNYLEY